jgi:DNA replication protein DnaC
LLVESSCHWAPSTYDDWGLEPLDAQARHDLLEILEERYGRRSTIVTSQLPVEDWHAVIGDSTMSLCLSL